MAAAWRDYRLTRLFPHWSMEQLAEVPHLWLERMLKMDEIAAEVAEHQAEAARKKAAKR